MPQFNEGAARRRQLVLIVVGLVLVGMGVGFAAALGRGHHHRGSSTALVILVAAVVLGVVLFSAWALWLYRRPSYRRVMQYGWSERKRVGKALRRGEQLTPEDLAVAETMIALQQRQWWVPLLFGLVIALRVAQAVTEHGFQRWLAVALAALYLILLPYVVWLRRRMVAGYRAQVGR